MRSRWVCNFFFKIICRVGDIRLAMAKTKLRQLEKKIIFDLFFQLNSFLVFFLRFLNIVCPNRIQKSHLFYKKKLQNLN